MKKLIIILSTCMCILCSCTSDNTDVTEKYVAWGENENWEAVLMPNDDSDQDAITIRFMAKNDTNADLIGFSYETSGTIITKDFEDFSLKKNEYISVSFGGHVLDTKALESNDFKALVFLDDKLIDNIPLETYNESYDSK